MSILGDIFHKIFPVGHPAAQTDPAVVSTAAAPGSAAPVPSEATRPAIDIGALLAEKAAHSGQKLNWDTSIVDLMKLLGLDSSLQNRVQLAHELKYTGDTNDSAAMNIWLHRQVMQQVAANGGTVPASLMK